MTFDEVRALALAWPGVEDGISYRTRALKVRGKLLTRLREDGETLVVIGVERDERDMLIEAAPDVFFVTPHYQDWPSVLVRLPATDAATIEPLLRRRWQAIVPKTLRAATIPPPLVRDGPDPGPRRAFAIKAEVRDPGAKTFAFAAQKTMYGGKRIAVGDTIFVFASETEGGNGLVARGIVASAAADACTAGLDRQTPRVSITIERSVSAHRPLGRRELKPFTDRNDGRPETELNFKLYRQATNKVIGLSAAAAAFLATFFDLAVAPVEL